MDNRLNKIRKEMNALRADMLRLEGVVRDQIRHDRDCTDSASRLMVMRAQLNTMVREWTQLGGIADLPTVEERLKGRRLPPPGTRLARLPRLEKRRLVGRA
jgi:hypothetical protein